MKPMETAAKEPEQAAMICHEVVIQVYGMGTTFFLNVENSPNPLKRNMHNNLSHKRAIYCHK